MLGVLFQKKIYLKNSVLDEMKILIFLSILKIYFPQPSNIRYNRYDTCVWRSTKLLAFIYIRLKKNDKEEPQVAGG